MLDKFAGYKTEIRILEKKLKELDHTKLNPTKVKELTEAIKNLKEIVKEKEDKREDRKKKKEEAAKAAPVEATVQPTEVVKESLTTPIEVTKESDTTHFAIDAKVEPTRGTPGSWGTVIRSSGTNGDPLVYVKWAEGPLKSREEYGAYYESDLKMKVEKEAVNTDYVPREQVYNLEADLKSNYEKMIADLQEEIKTAQEKGEYAWVGRLEEKLADIKKTYDEKYNKTAEGENGSGGSTRLKVVDLTPAHDKDPQEKSTGYGGDRPMGAMIAPNNEENSLPLEGSKEEKCPGCGKVAPLSYRREWQSKGCEDCHKLTEDRNKWLKEPEGRPYPKEASLKEAAEFGTHGNNVGLNDLYVLPSSPEEANKIEQYLKQNGRSYQWSNANVEGHAWYGKRFIEIPFGESLKEEIEKLQATPDMQTHAHLKQADEDADERRFERAVDMLDKKLMRGDIHQKEYDAEYAKLKKEIFPKEASLKFADLDLNSIEKRWALYVDGKLAIRTLTRSKAERIAKERFPEQVAAGKYEIKREDHVPVEAALDKHAINITVGEKLFVVNPLQKTADNEYVYDVNLANGSKLFKITSKEEMGQEHLTYVIGKELMNKKEAAYSDKCWYNECKNKSTHMFQGGKDDNRTGQWCDEHFKTVEQKHKKSSLAKLTSNLAFLKKGSFVSILDVDKTKKQIKFASLDNSLRGWAPMQKFALMNVPEAHLIDHDGHKDEVLAESGHELLVTCPANSVNVEWRTIEAPPATPESLNEIEGKIKQTRREWAVRLDGHKIVSTHATEEEAIKALDAIPSNMFVEGDVVYRDIPESLNDIESAKGAPGSLFNAETAQSVADRIKTEVKAPFVNAYVSTLGGPENVSVMFTIGADPKESWTNGILQNSRYGMFDLDNDGTIEQHSGGFSKWKQPNNALRKRNVKSVDQLIQVLNSFLEQVNAPQTVTPNVTADKKAPHTEECNKANDRHVGPTEVCICNKKEARGCDQCEAAMINGVFCHETGCPNSRKRNNPVYDEEDTEITGSLNKEAHIRHEDGKWVIYSHDYKKKLGTYDSEAEAKKRLRQIEYFKHQGSLKPLSKKEAADVMETKCEGCGKELGPEVFLSKWPVCRECTKKRHEKAVGKRAADEISIEQQVQGFRDRMNAVTERLATPPAKTADLETTQDLSNVDVKDLTEGILHMIDLLESKTGENVSADPSLHPMLEELENKVWEVEQKLGIKPNLPEHEKAEPEHKEIVEEVEKESAVDVKADDVNTPPQVLPPQGFRYAWEPKNRTWILVQITDAPGGGQ